jgi:hypothetical protein
MNFNLHDIEKRANEERLNNRLLQRLINVEHLSTLDDEQLKKFADRYSRLVMSFLHPDAGGDKESFQKFSEISNKITGGDQSKLSLESATDELEKENSTLKDQLAMFGRNTIHTIDRFEDIRHESPDIMSIFHKDGEVINVATAENDDGTIDYELWKLDGYGGVKAVEKGYFENITQDLGDDPEEFDKKNPHANYQFIDGSWYQIVSLNTDGVGVEYLSSPAIKQSVVEKSSIRLIGSAEQTSSVKNPDFDLLSIPAGDGEVDFKFDTTEISADELGKREINPEIKTTQSGTLYYTKNGKLYTRSCYQLFISK